MNTTQFKRYKNCCSSSGSLFTKLHIPWLLVPLHVQKGHILQTIFTDKTFTQILMNILKLSSLTIHNSLHVLGFNLVNIIY